jgi:hypothetical protein
VGQASPAGGLYDKKGKARISKGGEPLRKALRKNPIAPRARRAKTVRSVEDFRRKAQPEAEGYEEFMQWLRESRSAGTVRR